MSGRKFPPELLQKIRDAVNILEVVGETVVLRKSGANYVGLCPFHQERSPSFSVSEPKQLYHCYGCKRGGDIVTFVMESHGIGFPEAIEELAERARVPLPKEYGGTGEDPEADERRRVAQEKLSTLYKLNRFAAKFYHDQLRAPGVARDYLRKRGVTEDWERSFYAGAAPASWDALAQFLVAKKAPLPLAVELGLIRPSTQGGRVGGPGYFDLFRNRAMFPILDLRGRVAGFGGRMLPGESEGGGGDGPKYLNSPESAIFQKSKLAFGLSHAQKHIRERDEVVLVEGYFDVLGMHAAGFNHVVASCGTSLTVEHLNLFRRYTQKVTILFDGDDAGVNATERAMELGLQQGMILHGAVLPRDLDPDEILFDQETGLPLAQGKDAMAEILREAKPLLDVRIDRAIASAGQGPEARVQALKQIGGWLSKYTDAVGREVRVDHVRNRMGVSRDLLLQAMGGRPPTQGAGRSRPPEVMGRSGPSLPIARPDGAAPAGAFAPPPARAGGPGRLAGPRSLGRGEQILLAAMAKGAEFAEIFPAARAKLPPNCLFSDLFEYVPARDWVRSLLDQGKITDAGFAAEGMTLTDDVDPAIRSIVSEAVMNPVDSLTLDDVRGALNHALAKLWARISQGIKSAAAAAEAKKDAGLHEQLMKEYLDVQRKMKEFISFYDEA